MAGDVLFKFYYVLVHYSKHQAGYLVMVIDGSSDFHVVRATLVSRCKFLL
jgi:hypothetical protein